MRFFISICGLLILLGCSSPGGRFSGVEPIRVSVEGSVFDVYVVGDGVRAIRMNFEMLPTLAVIGTRAVAAIEQVTGCSVVTGSMRGDQVMVEARVKC